MIPEWTSTLIINRTTITTLHGKREAHAPVTNALLKYAQLHYVQQIWQQNWFIKKVEIKLRVSPENSDSSFSRKLFAFDHGYFWRCEQSPRTEWMNHLIKKKKNSRRQSNDNLKIESF